MCLRKCLEKDACEKWITGYEESELQGSLRAIGSWRPTFYRGDTSWTEDGPECWYVKEEHNIEIVGLQALHADKRGLYLGTIAHKVRQTLKNPHIYDMLVKGRMDGLIRHGLVSRPRSGAWAGYDITPEGVDALAQVAARRLLAKL